ncbi:MAG: hypothetical protein SF162_11125 [bacterium]|nr:hypothetical protein [bacterium]
MEPTLHFTHTPTIRLVMNEALAGEPRHDDWAEPALETRLEHVLETLDELHDAASDGKIARLTSLSKRELLEMLHELIYTAEQTVAELEDQVGEPMNKPGLSLVRKSS